MKWGRFLVLLSSTAATLFAAGCSSHAVYPSDWAAVPTGSPEVCPSLAGTYWNAGEHGLAAGASPPYSPPYLTSHFFEDEAAAAKADRIRISGAADTALHVEALGAPPALDPAVLQPQKHYRCQDGWVVIDRSRFVAENVSGFEKNAYRFTKADDGSIVVQINSSAVGLVLVVPVGGSSTQWQRFLPAD